MCYLPKPHKKDAQQNLPHQASVTDGEIDSVSVLSRGSAFSFERNSESHGDFDAPLKPFQSIQGLHMETFEAAVIQGVNPLNCVSIRKLRSRSICLWGIRMIRQTILGQRNADSYVRGFVSTGKFSVVVKIPEECFSMIVNHFIGEGKSKKIATSLAKEGPWYHVVDGGHIHAALVDMIEDFSENFAGFKWPVVVIPWTSGDNLRAISRMCHEMQRDAHLIDFTLPDDMQNLRDIIDTQCRRQGIVLAPGEKVRNGFIKEVMAAYSGRPGYADNTMRSICGIVVRLSSEVVHSIRLLLTEECDPYCEQLGKQRPFGDDTRVYKKLLSSQSLKGVKPFLGGAMRDVDKINVIHRLRFLARERECFKYFSSVEVDKQCENVISARNELLKFEDFLDEESWPAEMENLQRNMLQTTLLDQYISEHVESGEKNLLAVLVESYIKATGIHGSHKLKMYRIQLRTNQDNNIQTGSVGHDDVIAMTTENMGSASQGVLVSGVKKINGHGETAQVTQNLEDIFRASEIVVKRLSLLDFERNSSDLGGSFDFMLADPYQKVTCPPMDEHQTASKPDESLVDEKGIEIYLQCIRRLLVPGAHAFIFLNWKHVVQWSMLSNECLFERLGDPFLVVKDASKVQKMTMKGLQCLYEMALVLRKPGKHPSGFTVDKNFPYEILRNCRMPRWCNVVDGIPPPAERLTFKPTKVLVRPNEKPCSLYVELLRTFCPDGGKV